MKTRKLICFALAAVMMLCAVPPWRREIAAGAPRRSMYPKVRLK